MLQGSKDRGRVVEMVGDNHEAGWKIIRMKGGGCGLTTIFRCQPHKYSVETLMGEAFPIGQKKPTI